MPLEKYKQKRNFKRTTEPKGKKEKSGDRKLRFVVQRHAASRLHYDFRLEMEGVLKSWAVPKGPSLNPDDKRLAMMVEDHPYAYREFEGTIPEGNYGAGEVEIWDEGTYEAMEKKAGKKEETLLLAGLKSGSLKFELHGRKLKGSFALVQMKTGEKNAWLLIKHKDKYAVTKKYDAEDLTPKRSKVTARVAAKKNTAVKKQPAAPPVTGKKNYDPLLLKEKKLTQYIKPMLATAGEQAFDDEDWLFEIKWDGYRAVAELGKNKKLYSRNGLSFEQKFAPVFEQLSMQSETMVIDGEVVVYNEKGLPDFQALQHYQAGGPNAIAYQVFDLISLHGKDTTSLSLVQRKELLKEALIETDLVRYCDHVQGQGKKFFRALQQNNMEGMIAKRADSIYQPGVRSKDWLKIKHQLTEEVYIVGYTEPRGARNQFGALILAQENKKGKLTYCGHVGTGFDERSIDELFRVLQTLVVTKCPLDETPPTNTPATWVRPQLVCTIKFTHRTRSGIFRHPVFMGLRPDKSTFMTKTRKKQPATKTAVKKTKDRAEDTGTDKMVQVGGHRVKLTNPGKIYWPDEGYTKGDLVAYYNEVYRYILPYLKNRPESLNRFPNGITGDSFYHKDAGDTAPGWVDTVKLYSESTQKDIEYILCNNKATLLYLANLGCIDMNPWNSTVSKIDHPTYLILDLDPSDKNDFDDVIEVANATKEILDKTGADSFCKTSGATGLHVYVPMNNKYTYEQVKDFAHLLAMQVNNLLPDLTTLERSLQKRSKHKIYVDYLQNRKGQTIASAYSVRPKPAAPVSAPLLWKEVEKGLYPEQFTIKTMPGRLAKMGDIFKKVLGKGINLEKCLADMEKL
ncbi:DNA ligase D [Terrimonas rubra]|uniref:DNA ligase (ATP) n=1 Tax=Terrimonas rubra TaxID=1035890 RepID=A0ABW6A9K7_9BACT